MNDKSKTLHNYIVTFRITVFQTVLLFISTLTFEYLYKNTFTYKETYHVLNNFI